MRFHRLAAVPVLLAVCISTAAAQERVADLLKAVQGVGREGAGSAAARNAWDRIVAQGPKVLPQILEAMDTADTPVANWLRLAFDRIAEPHSGRRKGNRC